MPEALKHLQGHRESPLYPFVGSWNPRLSEVVGSDFSVVSLFLEAIETKLRQDWLQIEDRSASEYYAAIGRFADELQYPFRVFTLNYDRCVEFALGAEGDNYSRGFTDDRTWTWREFEETEAPVRLYKLHGSEDWRRDQESGEICFIDSPSSIRHSEGVVIFAEAHKLRAAEPYLYLAYELRRWSLQARMLVTIGYGFQDSHINEILRQSMLRGKDKGAVLFSVGSPFSGTGDRAAFESKQAAQIAVTMQVEAHRVIYRASGAREFLKREFSVSTLAEHLTPSGIPF